MAILMNQQDFLMFVKTWAEVEIFITERNRHSSLECPLGKCQDAVAIWRKKSVMRVAT